MAVTQAQADVVRARYDEHVTIAPEGGTMEYGFLSHAVGWLIALMALCTTVSVTIAFWTMGRQAYRKD